MIKRKGNRRNKFQNNKTSITVKQLSNPLSLYIYTLMKINNRINLIPKSNEYK